MDNILGKKNQEKFLFIAIISLIELHLVVLLSFSL